jgi:Tol biopolymer transport system component
VRSLAGASAAVAAAFLGLVVAGTGSSVAPANRLARTDAHLVFSSNRDGDDDVYAIDPSGKRFSALTRNSTDDLLLRSPNGRRLAVSRLDAKSGFQIFLLSADGRRERRVRTGTALAPFPEAFSPSSSRLAVSFRGGRKETYWDAVGFVGPDRRLRVGTPDEEDYEFLAWAPDGKSMLLDHLTYDDDDHEHHSLVVSGLAKGSIRVLASGLACQDCAAWGAAGRIAFLAGSTSGELELRLIDPRDPMRQISVARVAGQIDLVGWSPNGRQLAYLVSEYDSEATSLRLAQVDGSSSVVYRNPDESPVVAWSSSGDALAVESARGLDIVGLDGRARTRIRWPYGVLEAAWSPDASRLGLVLAGEGGGEDLWLANPRSGRLTQLTRRGKVERLGWAPGPVSAGAIPASSIPATELAGASALSANAPIYEISASGSWVAAVVEANPRDCTHVIAWRAGRRAVRFNTPAPCAIDERYYRLRLNGTRLSWSEYYCGNNCYTIGAAADLRRPGTSRLTSDERAFKGVPRRLPTPRETRREVTMTLARGTITLRFRGGVRTIRPPGGATDAELEQTGLFYSHNQRRRARVVFVPFARLRAGR